MRRITRSERLGILAVAVVTLLVIGGSMLWRYMGVPSALPATDQPALTVTADTLRSTKEKKSSRASRKGKKGAKSGKRKQGSGRCSSPPAPARDPLSEEVPIAGGE